MKRDDDTTLLAAARDAFLTDAPALLTRLEAALLGIEALPTGRVRLEEAASTLRLLQDAAEACQAQPTAALAREMAALGQRLLEGQLQLTEAMASALLAGRDQIGAHLVPLRKGRDDALVLARTGQLLEVLRGLQGATATPAPSRGEGRRGEPPGAPVATASAAAAWHLSLRFDPSALHAGVDPLALMRGLQAIGKIRRVEALVDDVPPLAQLDAERCHLGLEVRLDGRVGRDALDDVLAPARPHVDIELLPPTARPADFDALLQRRCGDDEAARARLLWVWLAMGVNVRLRDDAAGPPAPLDTRTVDPLDTPDTTVPIEPLAISLPQIERRAGVAGERRLPRRDRRSGEPTACVNVPAERLEQLVELLGELASASCGAQAASRLESSAALQLATQRVADLSRRACEGALALRRMPAASGLQALRSLAEELSASFGRPSVLTIHGGDTEIDATVADVLCEVLAHVLHNSLRHGIEDLAERAAAGKPELGQLRLHLREAAGAVLVEWSDDGRGPDRQALRQRAVEGGVVEADRELDDAELWELAFAPGLPRSRLRDGSPRTVVAGLDAVRRNIESLRGQVTMSGTAGRGTTTRISLPASASLVDGVLVLVGDSYYVVPMEAVDEVTDAPADAGRDPAVLRGSAEWHGRNLPWLDLVPFCGAASAHGGGRRSMIVVRDGRARLGLVVDRVLGRQHALLKPLAGFLSELRTLAGSTVLGSGDVGLVLDVPGIVAAAAATSPATGSPA
jgi:two-component system chemotaxis sensor kinase CheA